MAGFDMIANKCESGASAGVSAFYRRIAFIGALATLTLGVITLIAWMSGFHLLASVRAHYIPMAPSTALCFALLGGALLVQLRSKGGRAGRCFLVFAAAVVAAVAVLKLTEFGTGRSFGLEELLVRNPEMFGLVPTGRMAPITAGNFLLAGMALILWAFRPMSRAAGGTAFAMVMVSLVVLLGYWYGTPLLYGGNIIPVALSTAGAFLCVGVAMISAQGSSAWPLCHFTGASTRALLLRTFLPIIVAAVLVDGAVRSWVLSRFHVNPVLLSALAALVFASLLGLVITRMAAMVGGRLDRAEAERRKAQEELRSLNEQLEQRVTVRTRELREKNDQMEEELTMARELQLAMMPHKFPEIAMDAAERSALNFFSFYYPTGSVSGDYYDVMRLSDTSVGIFICDVMGHGVRAALVTAMMRALVGGESRRAHDPGELMGRINRGMISSLRHSNTTIFASAFYMVADVSRGEIVYANAGHPLPLHVKRETREVASLVPSGSGCALGLFPEATFTTCRAPISPGDLLVLFTDGLFEVESPTGEFFSHEELTAVVRNHVSEAPALLLPRVVEDVLAFAQCAVFEDDVCLIGMEVHHTA